VRWCDKLVGRGGGPRYGLLFFLSFFLSFPLSLSQMQRVDLVRVRAGFLS
jgi:hypothetical protein